MFRRGHFYCVGMIAFIPLGTVIFTARTIFSFVLQKRNKITVPHSNFCLECPYIF